MRLSWFVFNPPDLSILNYSCYTFPTHWDEENEEEENLELKKKERDKLRNLVVAYTSDSQPASCMPKATASQSQVSLSHSH